MPETFFDCIDIGGTNTRIAVLTAEGKIHTKTVFPTPKTLPDLAEIIKSKLNNERTTALCLSIAGVYDPKTRVSWLPNAFNGRSVSLSEYLETCLQRKITLLDDRTAGVLGEHWKGSGMGCEHLLYLIIGTGVGLGIMLNGRAYSGETGVAGSIGWNRYSESEKTLEEKISGRGIISLYERLTGIHAVRAEYVFSAAENGDSSALSVIDEVALWIGRTLGFLGNTFNPQKIILAGGISHQWRYFEKAALGSMRKGLSPYIRDIPITLSRLGEDAPLFGDAWVLKKSAEGSTKNE
jgi:glucokinase